MRKRAVFLALISFVLTMVMGFTANAEEKSQTARGKKPDKSLFNIVSKSLDDFGKQYTTKKPDTSKEKASKK